MTSQLKRWGKRLLIWGLVGGLTALTGLFLINLYVIQDTKNQLVTIESVGDFDPDCVLVLGAGVWEGSVPSPILKDRLDKAIEISQRHIETTLLMSGDHGQVDYDEVNVMKDYAMSAGLNSSDIFMDHAGFSTYESLYRAKSIFNVKKVIIVSQKSHLYRALYIAKALGIEAIGIPAKEIRYGGDFLREIRESLARAKDVVTAFLQPKATPGERIDIKGNGDLTNDR